MKAYSSELVAKLEAGTLVCFVLLDLVLDGTTYYYTDCDIPLSIDGHLYMPAVLQPGSVQSGALSYLLAFDFKISAQTTGLLSAFVTGTPRGGSVLLRMVFLASNYYTAYVTNVLTNPGFESGVMGDWSLSVGTGCTANASIVSSGAYQGTYCCKITITDGWGDATHVKDIMLQQNIPSAISSGYIYDMSFAAKAAASRYIAADVSTVAGSSYPISYFIELTDEWQFFNLPFMADTNIGAGNAYVNFYLARSDSNDDVYIDSVRFSPTLYPITLFKGTVDSWSLDEDFINIRAANRFAAWNQKTVRLVTSTCRWLKFKGEECQYSGAETWCDRTYKRCSDLGNTANFGGFRYVAALSSQTLWWGSKPYNPSLPPKPGQANWW